MLIAQIIAAALDFYSTLIIIYILSTWFPLRGTLAEIQRVLGSLVEPYLSIFRRVIPTFGNLDFSPVIAIIVLTILQKVVYSIF